MQRAATLIEVMVAAAILVIAIVGLLATFVYCLAWSESNNNMVTAAIDGQSVMEEIKNLAYNDITSSYIPQQEYTGLSSEIITVNVTEEDAVKEVTVNVSWLERGNTKNFSLITYCTP